MKVKKGIALLFVAMILLTQSMPMVSAQSQSAVASVNDGTIGFTPYWINVNDMSLDVYLENGNVVCVGTITGASGTTKIDATYTLERKTLFGWSSVTSWTKSSSNSTLLFSGSASGSTGNTYRLSVTAKVTRNGVTETVSTSVEGKF